MALSDLEFTPNQISTENILADYEHTWSGPGGAMSWLWPMVMVNGVTWTMVVVVRGVVIQSGEEVWKASVSSHEDSVIVHITVRK